MATERKQPQLPLAGPGARLKAAREAAGITRAGIAEKTRISERMIIFMEAGDFASLPAKTYATGFTRSYARAVGLDENELVEAVRRELGMAAPIETDFTSTYEPGDPARVPNARFASLLALGAVLVVAAGLIFWRTYYSPAMILPSILPTVTPVTSSPTPVDDAIAVPDASGSAMASDAPNPAYTFAPPVQSRARPRVRRESDSAVAASAAPPDVAAVQAEAGAGQPASTVSN